MTALLDSARLKLCRATEHLANLEEILRVFIESKPITLIPNRQPDSPSVDFHVREHHSIPPNAPTVLGDCIHNFRCVLDHIAMALAIKNGTATDDRSVAWPICDKSERFERNPKPKRVTPGSGRFKIIKLLEVDQAFVQSFQPYNRPNDGWLLRELEHLDNRDKHRSVNVHYARMVAAFEPPPGVVIDYDSTALVDGAHFCRVTYPPSYSGVDVEPPVVAGICTDSSTGGVIEIQPYLRERLLPLLRDEILPAAGRLW